MPTNIILGTVVKLGSYKDSVPLLAINVRKQDATVLPHRAGERLPIAFVVAGEPYIAGVRTATDSTAIMICSDLADKCLEKVRMADLLFRHGWSNTEKQVRLCVKNGVVHLLGCASRD